MPAQRTQTIAAAPAPTLPSPEAPVVKERSAEELNAEIAQRLAQQRKNAEEQEKLAKKTEAQAAEVKMADAPKDTPATEKAAGVNDEKKTAQSLNKAQLIEITPKATQEVKEIKPVAEAKPLALDNPAPKNSEAKDAPVAAKPEAKKAPEKTVQAAPAPVAMNTPVQDVQAAEAANKALNATRIWEGDKGDSLQKILKEWAIESHVELAWNTKESYKLSQNVIISGSFETALNVAFSQAVKNPPRYTLQKGAKPVLIIE